MVISIKTKLAIVIFACFMLPLLVFRVAVYPIVRHSVERNVEQRLIELGKMQDELLNTWLDGKKETASVISVEPVAASFIKDPLPKGSEGYEALLDYLNFIRDEYGLKGIFISDANGTVRMTTEIDMEHVDISGFSYFREVLDGGKTGVSQIVPSYFPILNEYGQMERNAPTLFVSTPIRDRDYAVIGVIGLRIDTMALNRELQRLNVGESGDTYLVDAEGVMLTNSRFTSSAKESGLVGLRTALELKVADRKSGELTRGVRECIKGRNGIDVKGYPDHLGRTVVGVWRWEERYNWGIISEIEIDEAYGIVGVVRNALSRVFSACVVVSVFVSIYLGWRLGRPLVQLSAVAKAVSTRKGPTDLITIKSSDEIGELADSFNTMVLSIREKDLITNFNEIVASNLLTDVFEAISNELRRVINFDRLSISCKCRFMGEERHFDTFVMTDGRPDKKASKLAIGAIHKLERSMTDEILRTGKPVIVEETQRGRFWSDTVLFNEGLHSRLGYPLTYKNEVIGSLNFSGRMANNFSPRQFFLLEKIAPVLAVALKNTLLFEAEKEREFVNRINQIIASSRLPDVFEAISKELRGLIGFDRISITSEYEGEAGKGCKIFVLTGELVPIESSKLKKGTISNLEGSIFGRVLKDGRPVIVPDTEKGDLWSDKDLLKEGIRSRLSYPLSYKGKIIASINFGSKKYDNFSEREIDIISRLAPQLAVAVENMQLLEKM